MFGHSFTVEAPAGEPLPKIPDDCVLVTIALCGDEMLVASRTQKLPFDKLMDLFKDPSKQEFLADPVTNKEAIEKAIGMPINIRYPGALSYHLREYIDIEYNGELTHIDWPSYGSFTYHTSGLYLGGTVDPITHKGHPYENYDVLNILKEIYSERVLYPNREAILSMVEEMIRENPALKHDVKLIKTIGQNFKIKQSELFRRFPGVYYVSTCRSAVTEGAKKTAKVHRTTSREKIVVVHDYDTLPTVEKMFHGHPGHIYRLPVGTTYANYEFPISVIPRIEVVADKDGRQVIMLEDSEITGAGAAAAEGGGGGGAGAGPRKMTKEEIAERKQELIARIMSMGYEGDIESMSIDELEALLQTLEGGNGNNVGSAQEAVYEYGNKNNNNNNYQYPNNNQGGGRRRRRTKKVRVHRRRLHTRRRHRRTLRR